MPFLPADAALDMGRFFNWPFKIYAIDADTGKPLDANVACKTYLKHYDIQKDKNGNRVFVRRRSAKNSDKDVTTKHVKANSGGDGKKGGAGADNKKNDAKAGGGGASGGDFTQDKQWTAKDDAKLKKMKADGKTWAEICAEFKCAKKVCQNRWKELEKADGGGEAETKANDSKARATVNEGKRQKAKAKAKADNENMTKPAQNEKKRQKPPSRAGSKDDGEARFTMNEWITLQEDDMFSFGELQCLSELIAKDNRQSWLRVAGAFFDLTGRRVHPDDIRDKFQQMAAML